MFWFKLVCGLVTGIFTAGAALLLFEKRLTAAIKDFLHDEVKIPTNHNSDELNSLSRVVNKFSDRLKEFGNNQRADHVQLKKDNSRIMSAIHKIHTDQNKLNQHQDILNEHSHLLNQHKKELQWIERHKVDKKKRGNSK